MVSMYEPADDPGAGGAAIGGVRSIPDRLEEGGCKSEVNISCFWEEGERF